MIFLAPGVAVDRDGRGMTVHGDESPPWKNRVRESGMSREILRRARPGTWRMRYGRPESATMAP
ncbi:MAG: hypothetical protein ACRYGL_10720 [Janthinobacterium lividum]